MPQERASIAGQKSNFYSQGFRQLIICAFALSLIAFSLIGLIVYQHLNRPKPQFFVTTSDGRLIEIQSLPS